MPEMEVGPQLENIKAIFLDLDGTIYLGDKLIDGALSFLERCREREIAYYFLSNNSSKSVNEYLEKLQRLGIEAMPDDVLLSTHDLIAYLGQHNYSETYVVGTEGMKSMLHAQDIETESSQPELVVVGYDTELTYEKLVKASVFLHQGVPLVASHPDMVCPSPNGGLPDVGAFLALFEKTTGKKPMHICGKPNPGMILHKIESLGLHPKECAMVGDRIYTDMEMAKQANVVSILVLSGEASLEDLDDDQGIDIIVSSIENLLR
jgi:4-nitrophenyl phosphatase/NagD protein